MSIVFDLTTYEGINNSIVCDVDSENSKTLHAGTLAGAVISPLFLGVAVGCTIGGLIGCFS